MGTLSMAPAFLDGFDGSPQNHHSEDTPLPRRPGRRTPPQKSHHRLHLGTGWLPEEPDSRDYTWRHAAVSPGLERAKIAAIFEGEGRLPGAVDLREWCPPVQFQGGFNTCSAHVVAALVEFFEKKAFGKSVGASRLFLHKVTQNLLQTQGNTGVYIRQTMGALKLVGVPPEKFWPYPDPGTLQAPRTSDPRLDEEPTAFCYAVADDYRAVSYYRLDPEPADTLRAGGEILRRVKAHLAACIPVAFGFPLHASAIKQSQKTGKLPFPEPSDPQVGNHAVVAVGYDDALSVESSDSGSTATAGAFRIQNSWSTAWGDSGYGWLPYEYLLRGAARDFWTLTKAAWVDTARFQLGLGS